MRYYALAVLIIIIDQISKWLVATKMDIGESIPVWIGVFSITSHRNEGAAFGILQGQMWLFYVITVIVVLGVTYYLHKYGRHQVFLGIALALILGGAIGNFIDRALNGSVVDFLYFRIINYPIFNIADASLVVGVILILIHTLLDGRKEKHRGGPYADSPGKG